MTFLNSSEILGGNGNENFPPDLISLLNTEKVLRFKADNGATFVRAESREGKVSIQSISNLQGDNIFRGADIVKIEAGIMHGSKFQPIASRMKILTVKKETVEKQTTKTTEENMAKKTGKIALAKELLKSGKTSAQVAARLVQSFKVSPQTAKNTTAWCKSILKKESAGA